MRCDHKIYYKVYVSKTNLQINSTRQDWNKICSGRGIVFDIKINLSKFKLEYKCSLKTSFDTIELVLIKKRMLHHKYEDRLLFSDHDYLNPKSNFQWVGNNCKLSIIVWFHSGLRISTKIKTMFEILKFWTDITIYHLVLWPKLHRITNIQDTFMTCWSCYFIKKSMFIASLNLTWSIFKPISTRSDLSFSYFKSSANCNKFQVGFRTLSAGKKINLFMCFLSE